jgi:hypothetical protein
MLQVAGKAHRGSPTSHLKSCVPYAQLWSGCYSFWLLIDQAVFPAVPSHVQKFHLGWFLRIGGC